MSTPRPLIDDELLEEVRTECKRTGRSVRAYVRGAIRVQLGKDFCQCHLSYTDLETIDSYLNRMRECVEDLQPTVQRAMKTSEIGKRETVDPEDWPDRRDE